MDAKKFRYELKKYLPSDHVDLKYKKQQRKQNLRYLVKFFKEHGIK